jgi:putative transposase
VEALQELAFKHPSYGFRKLFAYLRRSGRTWNHKKVYRVYKLLKLNKKRKGKRRLPVRIKQPLQQQTAINKSWSMDFMSDSMVGNRKFRTFNVIDDCTREVLAIEVDTSLSSRRIIRTLERVIVDRGTPTAIRTDNGLNLLLMILKVGAEIKRSPYSLFNQANPCRMAISNDLTGFTGKQYWMLICSLSLIR